MSSKSLFLCFFVVFLSFVQVHAKVDVESFIASASTNNNDYPIVLVHGFAGWGRNELLGLKYWGTFQGDLQEQLKAEGHQVLTAAVGPFSSNWDRACELYAQIKGGTVDYGSKHSSTHGHQRFGRTFKGLYPEWGTTDPNGKIRKVHLIGHSMGGQTIRMLAQLLAEGSRGAPIEEDPNADASVTHELFKGGKNDWIHSITTISTPNQGTLLADGFSLIGETIKDLTFSLLSILGFAEDDATILYDAKLDQWGLASKQDKESIPAYLDRIFKSPIFRPGFKDISLHSLSTEGAKEEIQWVKTQSNIFYYSFATEDTFEARNYKLEEIQLPNFLTMLLPLYPFSIFVGSRFGPERGFDIKWQQNDGVVPTASMYSDGVAPSISFKGESFRGTWHRMGDLNRVDHLAVVGLTLHTQMYEVYKKHADLLRTLPSDLAKNNKLRVEGVQPLSTIAPDNVTQNLNEAIEAFKKAAGSIETKQDLEKLCQASTNDSRTKNYCQMMLEKANQVQP
jgi:hypothetical protein